MKFTGAECVFCKNKFEDADDVVVCPVCGSPHHRKCWNKLNKCANSELHKDNYLWTLPEELKPAEKTKKTESISELQNFQFKNGEIAVQCPNCGALNYGNDAFCLKCKSPLDGGSAENIIEAGNSDERDTENYNRFRENQTRFGGLHPAALVNEIPAEEVSAYVGGGNPGRIIRRMAVMERYGRHVSFSFAAIIFGPVWFFYRKMFREGLLFALALLIFAFTSSVLLTSTKPVAEYYLGISEVAGQYAAGEINGNEFAEKSAALEDNLNSSDYSAADNFKRIASVVCECQLWMLRFIMAMKALDIYKKKMKRDILKIRGECSDFQSYKRRLYEKGGTSPSGAVLGVALGFLSQLIIVIPYAILIFK